jgi:hypothetical protein
MVPGGLQFSITNTQQVFPLAEIALEAHALGDLKRRDGTSLDLLAGFPGGLACPTILPAGLIEVRDKADVRRVPTEVGPVAFESLPGLSYLINKGCSVI